MKRAVVTGMGAITPLGNNVPEFWSNLVTGKSGASSITRFDTANHRTKFACEVKGFDASRYVEKQEIRKMDLYTQFAIAAADECMKDSGIDLDQCNRNRAGVIIATGIGGMITMEEVILAFGENGKVPKFNPFFVTKMISNMATGQLSIRYGLHGVSYTVTSACASANNAIANALDLIRLGRADLMLVGGSEACITGSALGGFSAMKALSTRNECPEAASRPFDRTRDGFVAGEGAGILLVEELGHALKRGARIYCELAGYGAASDAWHVAAPHPEGLGAVIAMADALTDAGLKAHEVDCINAHATSTPVGDISECRAIEKVFGDSLQKLKITASKSMIGHLLGAAGAVEAIACVKSVENNLIPPTINFKEPDPEINPLLNFTPNQAIEQEVRVVLNNTFGFGGHTSTTVFRKLEL
ncbi:MAG: beta-ketoacyl-ACP synthase II [Mangrovibacterium sp.]